jgi:hypothetical protein
MFLPLRVVQSRTLGQRREGPLKQAFQNKQYILQYNSVLSFGTFGSIQRCVGVPRTKKPNEPDGRGKAGIFVSSKRHTAVKA